jgi:putative transcriptional regulator
LFVATGADFWQCLDMGRRNERAGVRGARMAPGFVVATPSLRDPNFERTVVLLVEHGAQGSIGFVVNRPAPITFHDVAESIGADPEADLPVLLGGPVSRTGWVLFDPSEAEPDLLDDAVRVHEHLAITASRKALEGLAPGGGARRMLVVGYAGWGEGQLDGELAHGVWMPVSLDPAVVFDCPADERWERALQSAGIDPGRIMPTGGALVS